VHSAARGCAIAAIAARIATSPAVSRRRQPAMAIADDD
jgi:hypothetical protein